MIIGRKKEQFILALGDILCFVSAIWLTLFVRYSGQTTGQYNQLFFGHILAFTPAILLWLLVFFIFNLYGKQTIVFRRKILSTIINAQIVNSLLAVVLFYFIPYFGLTPKTNLFIYFVLSSFLMIIWRLFISPLLYSSRPEILLLIGNSVEADLIAEELAINPFHGYRVIRRPSNLVRESLINLIRSEHISVVMIHFRNELEKNLAASLGVDNYSKIKFVDVDSYFEELFDRIPLSKVNDWWFIESVIAENSRVYDILKRIMDILLALVLGIITLSLYPIAALLIWLEDRGRFFIRQERVGQYGHIFSIYKFRTMTGNDGGNYIGGKTTLRTTKVGSFLRKTRIDELPQLWNVIRGDLSLVGPRPEFLPLVKEYEAQIPFYGIRHLIKPGLSGWAQIYQEGHPHHGTAIEATREKLSFDLFYLKHRSFWLDIKIAFRTLQIVLSCVGM
ncbi:MAG: exopolysaccharide biosynthesis polyprenyl glycosylphosphotransferase [Candidatus Vogelbacteria bacterium]|nr:exopolysaccharide biosynthesis polyprenyl glycosylphosphotransferase [Candidatus Vogelbacteria bacterium]